MNLKRSIAIAALFASALTTTGAPDQPGKRLTADVYLNDQAGWPQPPRSVITNLHTSKSAFDPKNAA